MERGDYAPVATIGQKQKFLTWFIQRYDFKDRDAALFCRFLCNVESVLARTRFSDHPTGVRRLATIATSDVDFPSFKYYRKGKTATTDLDEAIHDIYANPDETIGVTLLFPERAFCEQFLTVYEEDQTKPLVHIDVIQRMQAEDVADQMTLRYTRFLLVTDVDAALDARDKRAFDKAVKALQEFDNEHHLLGGVLHA